MPMMDMTVGSSTIFIDDMRMHAFHGVMEQERHVGADFSVSLRVQYNIEKAMGTDRVADTLSYADLFLVVSEVMGEPSQLLEHVAGRMAKAIFARFPEATAVKLRIVKLNPPMGADCAGAGVELEVENQ